MIVLACLKQRWRKSSASVSVPINDLKALHVSTAQQQSFLKCLKRKKKPTGNNFCNSFKNRIRHIDVYAKSAYR